MSIAKFIKKGKIIQLQIIRFEGEMMEIIWPFHEEGPLIVGEYISYICEDKFVNSRVIRSFKDHVHLFIPNYRETLDFINYNRSFPRYNVNLSGLLTDAIQVISMNVMILDKKSYGTEITYIQETALNKLQNYLLSIRLLVNLPHLLVITS